MQDGLYIFGTCSGTEPMPDRHHTAFALSIKDQLYWFDAGECCSYTAHLMGVDVCNARAVFISHPHMDHVGGLGNLFWTMRKLNSRHHTLDGKAIDLFMPNAETWPAQLALLEHTEGNFRNPFAIREHRIRDGILFSDENVQVTALHNLHLPPRENGEYCSFSFSIQAAGMRIAYSGDVKSYHEIAPLLEGTHILLAETGHHAPAQVCAELNQMGIRPERLLFIHHGRAILNDCENSMQKAKGIYSGPMEVLSDGCVLPFSAFKGCGD